jgi:hypothetical protein
MGPTLRYPRCGPLLAGDCPHRRTVSIYDRSGMVPVRPELVAGVRYFGRYRTGWVRDAVLLSVG